MPTAVWVTIAVCVFLVFAVIAGSILAVLLKPDPHADPSYRFGHDKLGPEKGGGWSWYAAGVQPGVACQLAISGYDMWNKRGTTYDHDKALVGCLDYISEREGS